MFLKKAIQSASIGAGLALPSGAFALQPEGYTIPDSEVVDGQQATGNRLDLNSAYVTDYKQFRGLYPTVAGKIASNGPYVSTSDVKKMAKLTEKEMKIFKQYEKEFVVLPPGRQFLERVNARQST
ncbi:hypothetical protein TrLO_g13457 [Triparma laevis f. longispina]|uniref:Photosystem II 12 kDa extrinsic protein n=1 Tax=Triparma laevis f. longispina TaxID=1714387 RepID=A0A9W7FUS2_9STRA|nr:hypothetical protein TrLO_g13457 [Triparma laevis f. longispina]